MGVLRVYCIENMNSHAMKAARHYIGRVDSSLKRLLHDGHRPENLLYHRQLRHVINQRESRTQAQTNLKSQAPIIAEAPLAA